jgi:hypothetical protein
MKASIRAVEEGSAESGELSDDVTGYIVGLH